MASAAVALGATSLSFAPLGKHLELRRPRCSGDATTCSIGTARSLAQCCQRTDQRHIGRSLTTSHRVSGSSLVKGFVCSGFKRSNAVHGVGTNRMVAPKKAGPPNFGVDALVQRPRHSVVAAALKEKEEIAKKNELDEEPFWRLTEPWDIPWTGKTTAFTMTAWLIGFILTGIVVPLGAIRLGYAPGDDADSKALFVLAYELAQTVIGLSIIYVFTKPFAPLGDELFKFDLSRPFSRKDGWALYAVAGFVLAFGAVQAAANFAGVGQETGGTAPRDAGDALSQLLPIIGASPFGTASLITVTGICAPLLEETVFRGFFLPSLTKWLPTWAAILISSFAFAAAHVTPGELPQLTALGVVLGITYTQTRNLACPMLIHSLWNSGVIIVLTVLKVNGVDIKEFV